ncbi:MAG: arsenate reductase ArsC [Anaerolineales bacterium]
MNLAVRQRVLFLCIHNSARSQMAEGWLRSLGGAAFEAASAGTDPMPIRPEVIEVMREVGLDLAGYKSKAIADMSGQSFDVAVTVCDEASEACPVFTRAKRTLHWSIQDPAVRSRGLEGFREARDEIRGRIEAELLDP